MSSKKQDIIIKEAPKKEQVAIAFQAAIIKKSQIKPLVKKQKTKPIKTKKDILKKKVQEITKVKKADAPKEKTKVQEITKVKKADVPKEKKKVQTSTLKPLKETKAKKQVSQKKSLSPEAKESFLSTFRELIASKKTYPNIAKRREQEGVVTVFLQMHKDGTISAQTLSKSSGYKSLDKAALKLILSITKYKPLPDDVSMDTLGITIPIAYTLN